MKKPVLDRKPRDVSIMLNQEEWNYICLVHRDMADALEKNQIPIWAEEPGTREALVQQNREMADKIEKMASGTK